MTYTNDVSCVILDRSIDEIAQRMAKRDEQISEKWRTDRQHDVWFAANGIRLVRITDR